MKWNRANTVIARNSVRNLRHPSGALAPPFLKCQKSTINILHESDILPAQALPVPKAGGDNSVLLPKASGYLNVPLHQMGTIEIGNRLMEAIVFTKTLWPISSDEKYSRVDKAWKLPIKVQNVQRALAGATVSTPSVWQLPGGPSLNIDPQTWQAISVYSVFYSLIGLVMIRIRKIYTVKNKD